MTRVLITGMSGTGKSTVVELLVARGYRAIDTDYGWCEAAPDGEWIWSEERIRALLAGDEGDLLFVAGCASNQRRFYPRFDHIILLSAPRGVMMERLRTRTNNAFGRDASELELVLSDLAAIEPLLRASADHEVVTTGPATAIVEHILALVAGRSEASSSGPGSG